MTARDALANAATLVVVALTYAHVVHPILTAIARGGRP
jgi:hypothetical protein